VSRSGDKMIDRMNEEAAVNWPESLGPMPEALREYRHRHVRFFTDGAWHRFVRSEYADAALAELKEDLKQAKERIANIERRTG